MFSFYGPFLAFSGQLILLHFPFIRNDFQVSMYNNPLSYFRQGKNSYIWLITTPKGLFFSFLSEREYFYSFCEETSEDQRTFLIHYSTSCSIKSSRVLHWVGYKLLAPANIMNIILYYKYPLSILVMYFYPHTFVSFPNYEYLQSRPWH